MWKQEDRIYTLCLAQDEITHKSIHLITGRWNHGYRIIFQIVDNDPTIINSRRVVYDKWLYDSGGDENIPKMALWLFALGSGEVQGRTTEYLIEKIFEHILCTFDDVLQEFVKHFPETAKQM